MLLLFLDRGLRISELLHLAEQDLHFADQRLKVMGKGQKERGVPFGSQASKLLQRYFYYFRHEPLFDHQFFLWVNGSPMNENTIKLISPRLAKWAGIARLHIHLLRHTFAARCISEGTLDELVISRTSGVGVDLTIYDFSDERPASFNLSEPDFERSPTVADSFGHQG